MGALGILLFLAVVQGLTEYLPVSSSGHLELAKAFLPGGHNLPEDASVVVLLHLGTLMAVLVFYRKEVVALTKGVLGLSEDASDQRRLFGMLALGTLPLLLVALSQDWLEAHLFNNPVVPSVALLVTGLLLYVSAKFVHTPRGLADLRPHMALLIGLAQAMAVTPGISRSGSTIVMALALGLAIDAAASFSFLLSIPAILGAGLLKVPEALAQTDASAYTGVDLGLAFLVSALVGYMALGLLLWIARARKLIWFAPYCWCLGILGLVLSFTQ